MTFSSEALVATDRPERYGNQLVKHFSNKIDANWDGGSGVLQFGFGDAAVHAEEGVLRMRVNAGDRASLERMEQVVASHLVRFGQRDELKVEWKSLTDPQ
jgi:uncharacterized protein